MGASVRMEGYYSSEQMIARLHLLLRGRLRPVLLLGGVLLMMGGAALLVNPSGTNRTTAQGPASDPSTSSLTATRNRLASPPQIAYRHAQMASNLFAKKPLELLLEEMKGENRLRRILGHSWSLMERRIYDAKNKRRFAR